MKYDMSEDEMKTTLENIRPSSRLLIRADAFHAPADVIPTRVHNASHSSMLCLVSMMLHVFSCVEICAIMSHMNHRFADPSLSKVRPER